MDTQTQDRTEIEAPDVNRKERAAQLLETFRGYPWLRVLRENGKPYIDLTREDCDLIAYLLRAEADPNK